MVNQGISLSAILYTNEEEGFSFFFFFFFARNTSFRLLFPLQPLAGIDFLVTYHRVP